MPDDPQTLHLTRRERQIMDILFAQGPLSVNAVQRQLPDPPTQTAVRTLLHILCDKGVVKRHKPGREYLYSPRARRERAGHSAMDKVVQTFFDGSLEKAVGSYLSRRNVQLSNEERQRLKKMIDDAR